MRLGLLLGIEEELSPAAGRRSHGRAELVGKRMARRRDHFMPLSLLKNQFDVLEEPQADENALVISIAMPAQQVVQTIIAELGLAEPRRS